MVVYAQTVIENPKTGLSLNNNSKITKVELTDSTTILSFHTTYIPGNWISIPKETYIQPVGSEKLFIKRTEGIPLKERYTMPASGEVNYKLIFPAVAKTTGYIDYGEANAGGSWFIYDIEIKPNAGKSLLPTKLSGNWFDVITGNWEFGFYNNCVVYQNKLWSYEVPTTKKSLHSVKLRNKDKSIELYYKTTPAGTMLFGLTAKSLKEYNQNAVEAKKKKPADDKPYELPVFKADSATYCGYVKDYTPRVGVETLAIAIDDIITGKQNAFVIRIAENGFFSVKLPVYYPHLCWVRSSLYNGSVFLEPGKEVFQLLATSSPLFMGKSAKINTDLFELMKINSFNYTDTQNKVIEMSANQYKTYIEKYKTKDRNSLDSIMKTNTISAKAYQVMKMNLEYDYDGIIMMYKYNFESAYRKKNNIPQTQRTIAIKTDSLTVENLGFINNESVNNPLAILSSGYNSFINRLRYLEILHVINSYTWNTTKIAADLEKSGYTLTDSEKSLVEKTKELELIKNSAEEKSYSEKYGKPTQDFFKKYMEDIQKFNTENSKADLSTFEEYFKKNKIKLTADEELLLKAMVEHDKSESALKMKQLYVLYMDSTNAFQNRHRDFVNEQFFQTRNASRNDRLKKLFNVQPGQGMDIINAQDICSKIVAEVSPVSDEKLKIIQQQFSTPFIADYVALCNNQSMAKLEANKKKTGFVVNETPKTEAAKIFDAIIKKYKGKVIYVDFWATWCGPCLSGIEQIKPLKEELKDKDIVFVYITDESSPTDTWNKLIPDIKGEHYRLKNDEWNFLKSMFNVTGIPHYVLVGKTGEIINPDLGHFDNIKLRAELDKYIKE
jgi:thiol-disulfide isomerase/thioredoxin